MADMQINKQSVRSFLSSGITFLIPDYQRQYSWKKEHCETLWEDIEIFLKNALNEQDEEYFLGSIVGFVDENNKNVFEVIDGQQRITTLNLLFRALYKKASDVDFQTPNTKGYVKSFGKCLWVFDEGSEKLEFNKPYLKSKVALDTDIEVLKKILSKDCKLNDTEKKSLYAKNFAFFCDEIDKFVSKNFDSWKDLCDTILNKIVILPIECKNQENAMRIFTTLNDRGMPLSDSDIIKGKIYANLKTESEKEKFAKEWKELESSLIDEESNEKIFTMDFLFVQYTHILRARDKNTNKEIGLRKFYTMSKYKDNLKDAKIMQAIKELAELWAMLWYKSDEKLSLSALQMFNVLWTYPNDYWKALISAYYFYCKENHINFFDDKTLLPFLKKVIATLFVIYLNRPEVNAVKDPIFNAYASLYDKNELDFKAEKGNKNIAEILSNEEDFRKDFFKANRLLSALITLNLYIKFPKQKIIESGEIEHIFPQKWQNTNYNGWDRKEAKEFLEHIGNKMWLEKKINIQAGNGYFGQKKEKYRESNFEEAKELASYPKDDWLKDDIIERGNDIYQRLLKFFKENV